MKRFFILFSLFAVILLFSCGESREKYNHRALAFVDSVNNATDTYLAFATAWARSWRSIIFDYRYISPVSGATEVCVDMNEGLAKYAKEMKPLDSLIFKKHQHVLDSLFKTLKKYPSDSKNLYELISELYTLSKRAYKMAMEPSGSLQTYTQNLNDLETKYEELKSKIDLEKQ
jgi:hypothetical protein